MVAAGAFDAASVGWISDRHEACEVLASAPLDPLGFISDASNGTMLCRVEAEGDDEGPLFAVYKPGAHERPLWDFPGELFRREVAAYALSDALGWDLVPPTVERDGPRGPGSLQLFVPHDPSQHYFALIEQRPDEGEGPFDVALTRMAMFDMVANNADRKAGHVLRCARTDRLYGIDNGLCFHTETKLRTVIWDLPEVPFDDGWKADLAELEADLADDGPTAQRLAPLLTVEELVMLELRLDQVRRMDAVPEVHPDERWYPWPPI